MNQVEEIAPVDAPTFERDVRPQFRPVVMRGVAGGWPVVHAGKVSAEAALEHIAGFDTGRPTDVMIAPQTERGRFFYSDDMRGFNFRRESLTLGNLAAHLREIAEQPDPIGIYAGATAIASHLPGFDKANRLPLIDDMGAVSRIWIGNATQVATHFDLSDNIAVVATGKRRFTLFPPEAVADLYVGPLNVTLAGQPVSMVDPLAPDHDRFPRYANAERRKLVVDLEPGDAIYIPTLWWHHVAASDPINVLVNYWHNDAERGGGFLALVHAMLAIRDQPPAQREAWRAWFDHMVFGSDAPDAAAHLPQHAQGVNGPPSPARDDQIRRFILQVLSS
ncbi:cupin-like domain-containing protein [Erythrobacter sp. JK5]|uniref:cupin-like domain-containing protein n=1 Tax=Erythrobacter sp. JK5 TaxID=2829500 RepID=UPI001BA65596|nr:cupin-like domain-containing protein [Erythrobacter sp. JK5]QUL37985.1 cupin-like domain-containing protein [Erythrobacter sp. JK5]